MVDRGVEALVLVAQVMFPMTLSRKVVMHGSALCRVRVRG